MGLEIQTNTSYVEVATSAALQLQKFTVVGWWRQTDVSGVSYRSYWGLGRTTDDRIFASIEATSGKLFTASQETGLTKYRTTYAGGFVPRSGEWYHAAFFVDISGGTQDVWVATHMINGGYPGDPTFTNDASSTGALALSSGTTFRVGQNHDGDSSRDTSACVRLFDRILTPQEVRANMWSRLCPPEMATDCLVDLPFEGNLINFGRLGGVAVSTGTTSFGLSPPLGPVKRDAAKKAAATAVIVNATASPGVIAATGAVPTTTRQATASVPAPVAAAAGAVLSPTLAPLSAALALHDDFTGTVIDTTKWDVSGSDVTQSGHLILACSTGYATLNSHLPYNIVGSAISVHALSFPTGATCQTMMWYYADSGNSMNIYRENTSLIATMKTAFTPASTTVTFDPVAHAWWRIRESAGTVYFETSPDGQVWTTIRSDLGPGWIGSGATVFLQCGSEVTETLPGNATFDDFNIISPSISAPVAAATGAVPTVSAQASLSITAPCPAAAGAVLTVTRTITASVPAPVAAAAGAVGSSSIMTTASVAAPVAAATGVVPLATRVASASPVAPVAAAAGAVGSVTFTITASVPAPVAAATGAVLSVSRTTTASVSAPVAAATGAVGLSPGVASAAPVAPVAAATGAVLTTTRTITGSVSAPVAAATGAVLAASLKWSSSATPGVAAATGAVPLAPYTSTASVPAPVAAATGAVPAALAISGVIVVPAVVAALGAVNTSTFTITASVSAPVAAAAGAVPAVSKTATASVPAPVAAALGAVPSATTASSTSPVAPVAAASGAVLSTTLSATGSVSAPVAAAVGAVPSASAVPATAVNPGVIPATGAVGATTPSGAGATSVTAPVVSVTGAVPLGTAKGTTKVFPSFVAVAGAVGSPSFSISSVVAADSIDANGTIYAPDTNHDQSVLADVIACDVRLRPSAVKDGPVVNLGVIAATGAVPTPTVLFTLSTPPHDGPLTSVAVLNRLTTVASASTLTSVGGGSNRLTSREN